MTGSVVDKSLPESMIVTNQADENNVFDFEQQSRLVYMESPFTHFGITNKLTFNTLKPKQNGRRFAN